MSAVCVGKHAVNLTFLCFLLLLLEASLCFLFLSFSCIGKHVHQHTCCSCCVHARPGMHMSKPKVAFNTIVHCRCSASICCQDNTTQTSPGHHLYNQTGHMLHCNDWHTVAVIVIFQSKLTFRLLRSSSDSELLAESELLLSRLLKLEDRSSSFPCTTGRVGTRGLPSAAAPAPPAVPGNLKFADRWFLHCFVR